MKWLSVTTCIPGRNGGAIAIAIGMKRRLRGVGPRATPTIVEDRVYTLGATGILNCLDLATGERVWSEDILYDNDAEIASWGISGSPLVLDDLVVVSAGGGAGKSLVAYHKDTGERIWRDGSSPAGYSSPLITTLAGVPQILIFNYGSVAAHDPNGGQNPLAAPLAQYHRVHFSTGTAAGRPCFRFKWLRHRLQAVPNRARCR